MLLAPFVLSLYMTFKVRCYTKGLNLFIVFDLPPPSNNPYLGTRGGGRILQQYKKVGLLEMLDYPYNICQNVIETS